MQPASLSRLKIRALVNEGESVLAQGPHPERARLDSEALLLHIFRRNDPERNRAWLLAHWNNPTSPEHRAEHRALIQRRLAGEPIQYITGETEFYGLPFHVTPDVLIPRPETEHLVEKVLELAARFPAPRIVDIGTGSGAIAIALAHHLSLQIAESLAAVKGTGFSPYLRTSKAIGASAPEGCLSAEPPASPHAQITAIDLSAPALAIARQNATRNGAAIRFLQGDLLAPIAAEQFEIIVSNPPYVAHADRDSLAVEVRDHEPHLALFAGDEGLNIYRRLIPAAHAALVPGGFLALEIGYGQAAAIQELLSAANFHPIEFAPDLQGIPRVASARRR